MNVTYEQLISLLLERGINFFQNDENHCVFTDFRINTGVFRIVFQVNEGAELFQVFGYCPILIPKGARSTVAETVARANYGLRVGKFEMDFDSGDLRFYVAHVLTGEYLEEMVFVRLMSATISMLDRYVPAILSVIYGNELPKDAIRCVEERWDNDNDSASDDSSVTD